MTFSRYFWVGLCLCASLLLVACKQELLTGLNQIQANEVIALLENHNISAHKQRLDKSGYQIMVEEKHFAAALDLLKIYGLPSQGVMEISQLFPSDALVSTPNAEKARLLSGQEQRLEQSLRMINGVVLARVHLSYDLQSDARRVPKQRVSVLIVQEGRDDKILFTEKIKRFIKNAFESLEYDDISVTLFDRSVAPQLDRRMGDASGGTMLPAWLSSVVLLSLSLIIFLVLIIRNWLNGTRASTAYVAALTKRNSVKKDE